MFQSSTPVLEPVESPIRVEDMQLTVGRKMSKEAANWHAICRQPLPPSLYTYIFREAGYLCAKCKDFGFLQVHHIIPVKENGPNCKENLIALCQDCHDKEHHRDPSDPMDREITQLKVILVASKRYPNAGSLNMQSFIPDDLLV